MEEQIKELLSRIEKAEKHSSELERRVYELEKKLSDMENVLKMEKTSEDLINEWLNGDDKQ